MSRIDQEQRTLAKMMAVYCRKKHRCGVNAQNQAQTQTCAETQGAPHNRQQPQLCEPCAALLEYATARLNACVHGENKPSCRKCPIHCYAPAQREKIREVMRYVGPRMLYLYPKEAVLHWISERFR